MGRAEDSLSRKVRDDGRAISAAQHGIHKNKKNKGRYRRGRQHQPRLRKEILDLISSKDYQEQAWYNFILHPFTALPVRVPITQVTGAIPVDLYVASVFVGVTTNSSGYAFVSYEADGWHGNKFLGDTGNSGNPMVCTINTYAGTTSPVVGSVATGVNNVALPDISPDFTSGAESGTEYIQVAGGLMISCRKSNSSSDRWTGMIYAVRTTDPHQHPLTAKTLEQLRVAAAKQGSSYELETFHITGSGLLMPEDLYEALGPKRYAEEQSTVLADHGHSHVYMPVLPVTKQAYEWQIINGSQTTTIQQPSIAFFVEDAPSGAVVDVTSVCCYQTERYPSYKISDARVGRPPMVTSTTDGLQSLVNNGQSLVPVVARPPMGIPNHVTSGEGLLGWLGHKISQGAQTAGQIMNYGSQILGTGLPQAAINFLTGGGSSAAAPTVLQLGPSLPDLTGIGESTSFVEEIVEGGEAALELLPLLAL